MQHRSYHHANFKPCRTSPMLTASSVCERRRSTFRIEAWFTPTSWAKLRLLLYLDSPTHDRERPTQRMQSGQFVCVRSRAFLPAGLLSLEVNDQQKRMRFDVANFFLDTVSDKYSETLRGFLSLLRKPGALSVTSIQHKRRLTNAIPLYYRLGNYSRLPDAVPFVSCLNSFCTRHTNIPKQLVHTQGFR